MPLAVSSVAFYQVLPSAEIVLLPDQSLPINRRPSLQMTLPLVFMAVACQVRASAEVKVVLLLPARIVVPVLMSQETLLSSGKRTASQVMPSLLRMRPTSLLPVIIKK